MTLPSLFKWFTKAQRFRVIAMDYVTAESDIKQEDWEPRASALATWIETGKTPEDQREGTAKVSHLHTVKDDDSE